MHYHFQLQRLKQNPWNAAMGTSSEPCSCFVSLMKHMIHPNLSLQQQKKKSAPPLECLFIQWSQNIDARKAKTKGGWGVARELLHKSSCCFCVEKKKKKEYYKKCDFGIRGVLFNLASTLPAPILDVRCALTVHAPLFIQRAPSTRGSNEIKAGDVAVRGRWECYRCSDLLWPAAAHLSGTIVRDPGISQWRASLIHPAKVHLLWLNILKQPNGCAC